LYNPNDKSLYIVDQNLTNILSKNSNSTKSMAIAVNTTNNIINKFETDFIVDNIIINPSTNQAYLLGYDGNNSKLFIVKPH
jgi:two-component SAPR family response regulator